MIRLPTKFVLAAIILIFSINHLNAQFENDLRISVTSQDMPVQDLIELLQNTYNLQFRYKTDWIENIRVSANLENISLSIALNEMFEPLGFSFIYRNPNYIIFIRDGVSRFNVTPENIDDNQIISIGKINQNITQATLSGIVRTGEENKLQQGVTVTDKGANLSAVTDANGRYELVLPVGIHTIRYQSVDLTPIEVILNLNSSGELNINLYKNVRQLEDVIVTGEFIEDNVSKTIAGIERITSEQIKVQPALLGQADLIKSLITLAGVNVTGESSAGFNVRGSGTGANLILLDDAIIFNPSHLFGVFSSISPEVIRDAELYKGTIPSKFGGRIASVLNINHKSGNKQKFTGSGGVGLISSYLNMEIPLVANKSSLITSLRGAYPNYLVNRVPNNDFNESKSFFGDISLKYDNIIDQNNILFITLYGSNNGFDIRNELKYDYNNLLGTVHWNHSYDANLTSELSYSFSQYNYSLGEQRDEQLPFRLYSALNNHKIDLNFASTSLKNHLIEFGFDATYHDLKPGDFSPDETALIYELSDLNPESGIESGLYLSDEYDLSDKLSIYSGLRFSYFRRDEGQSYNGLEPRVSLNYQTGSNSSVKAGYNRMRQYIHLISNTSSVTPTDIWKLSNRSLKPSVSNQLTLGYFKNFSKNISTSIEGYYKTVKDLVDYRNGANLFGNPDMDEELLQGTGEAYGVEVNLEKKEGKVYGRLSYTYSRTFLEVNGATVAETINRGNPYPTNFDQPHNLNIIANIQTSRRFRFSFNFAYNTGRPITYPASTYNIEGISVSNYNLRNAQRIPDYHRLDFSIHLSTSLRKQKKVEANWTLTLYNLYGRKNAYSVFFRTSENNRLIEAYKLSIIGQIVPALSYTFKF